VEEFQELLTRIRLEKDAWEKKYHKADTENKELKEKVKEKQSVIARQVGLLRDKKDLIKAKDALLRQDDKRKKKQVDFFSSGFDPDFDEPPATRART
jgi:aspartate oxidase